MVRWYWCCKLFCLLQSLLSSHLLAVASAKGKGAPNPLKTRESLQYFLEVKYKVVGTAVKLKKLQQLFPLLAALPHVGMEYVGRCVPWGGIALY